MDKEKLKKILPKLDSFLYKHGVKVDDTKDLKKTVQEQITLTEDQKNTSNLKDFILRVVDIFYRKIKVLAGGVFKVRGNVKVDNMPEIFKTTDTDLAKGLAKLYSQVAKLETVIKGLKFSLPSVYKATITNVNQFKTDLQKVAIQNPESIIKGLKEVKITNANEIKSDVVKISNIEELTKRIDDLAKNLKKELDSGVTVAIKGRDEATSPIAVRLSDGDKFVDLLQKIIVPRGSSKVTTVVPKYALQLVESGDITYIGEATPGTTITEAKWRIKKIDESSGMVIKWADGNSNFDKTWDDYLELSYS